MKPLAFPIGPVEMIIILVAVAPVIAGIVILIMIARRGPRSTPPQRPGAYPPVPGGHHPPQNQAPQNWVPQNWAQQPGPPPHGRQPGPAAGPGSGHPPVPPSV